MVDYFSNFFVVIEDENHVKNGREATVASQGKHFYWDEKMIDYNEQLDEMDDDTFLTYDRYDHSALANNPEEPGEVTSLLNPKRKHKAEMAELGQKFADLVTYHGFMKGDEDEHRAGNFRQKAWSSVSIFRHSETISPIKKSKDWFVDGVEKKDRYNKNAKREIVDNVMVNSVECLSPIFGYLLTGEGFVGTSVKEEETHLGIYISPTVNHRTFSLDNAKGYLEYLEGNEADGGGSFNLQSDYSWALYNFKFRTEIGGQMSLENRNQDLEKRILESQKSTPGWCNLVDEFNDKANKLSTVFVDAGSVKTKSLFDLAAALVSPVVRAFLTM